MKWITKLKMVLILKYFEILMVLLKFFEFVEEKEKCDKRGCWSLSLGCCESVTGLRGNCFYL